MSGASELVERLRAAMEGVTPGPWTARLMERNGVVQDAFVQANDVNGFAYKAEILGDDEYREESGGLTRKLADVRYIALCSPDNIATLLAELARLSSAHSEAVEDARKHLAELSASRAEVVGLREALAVSLDELKRQSMDLRHDDATRRGYMFAAGLLERIAALAGVKPVGAGVEDAVRAGWNACRRSIYAVCEDVQNEAERLRTSSKSGTPSEEQHAKGYYAGACYAAKSIARGFHAMEADDDDNVTAAVAALSKSGEKP